MEKTKMENNGFMVLLIVIVLVIMALLIIAYEFRDAASSIFCESINKSVTDLGPVHIIDYTAVYSGIECDGEVYRVGANIECASGDKWGRCKKEQAVYFKCGKYTGENNFVYNGTGYNPVYQPGCD